MAKVKAVEFYSDGIRLDGIIQLPEGLRPGEKRPAVMVCSGRLGLKEWVPPRWMPQFLDAGYVCMTFDYRNLGSSDGERGRLFPEEEIRDVMHAITFLQQQPEVDPDAIGLVGWALGGGVVISVAARDQRVRAVCCAAGLGDAGRTVRDAVPYEAWLKRQKEVAADRIARVMTGKSAMISYTEVTHPGREPAKYVAFNTEIAKVKDQAEGRKSAIGHGHPDAFTLESAEALYNFRPELEVDRISPRPVLIIHGTEDTYYPIDEATSLYAKAREPKELIVIEGGGHLDWIDLKSPLHRPNVQKVVDWFKGYMPVKPKTSKKP